MFVDNSGSRCSWLSNVGLVWLGFGMGDKLSAGRSDGDVI